MVDKSPGASFGGQDGEGGLGRVGVAIDENPGFPNL